MFKKTLIVFLIALVASIFGAVATYDHLVYAQIPGLTDSQQESQSQEQQGHQQQQDFLTFENATYKFKIQYPSDWQVKPVGSSPPSGYIRIMG
jgi:PsbP-like protein